VTEITRREGGRRFQPETMDGRGLGVVQNEAISVMPKAYEESELCSQTVLLAKDWADHKGGVCLWEKDGLVNGPRRERSNGH
jgi:hypothetical protein